MAKSLASCTFCNIGVAASGHAQPAACKLQGAFAMRLQRGFDILVHALIVALPIGRYRFHMSELLDLVALIRASTRCW